MASSLPEESSGAQEDRPKICAATRLHVGDMSKPPDLSCIADFVKKVSPSVSCVAVALGVPGAPDETALQDLAKLVQEVKAAINDEKCKLIPVHPWGKFIPALNALLSYAATSSCDYILFASVEAVPEKVVIDALSQLLIKTQGLVAGAALPGHDFQVGERQLTGLTTPWNTLALWQTKTLALTGFPLLADGIFAGVDGGVEETSAIECIHRISASRHSQNTNRAFLLRHPGVSWEISQFENDAKRAQWHTKKMKSKFSRAARHLQLLSSSSSPSETNAHATVTHLEYSPSFLEPS